MGKKVYTEDVHSHYLRYSHAFDYLDSEEEFTLVEAWQQKMDAKALHRLASSHLRLVNKIAKGYRGYGLSSAEMISEGYLGMLQALRKFEPKKGIRFATYATWWIHAYVRKFILNSWSLVRMGTRPSTRKLFFKLRKTKKELGINEGAALSPEGCKRIAKHLDVSEKDVEEMNMRLSGPDQSLNTTVGSAADAQDSATWEDMLVDETLDQEHQLLHKDEVEKRQKVLSEALMALNPREINIFQKRRLTDPPETLDSLGASLNISIERVRQIETKAFQKLQKAILSHPLCAGNETLAAHLLILISGGPSELYFPNMFQTS